MVMEIILISIIKMNYKMNFENTMVDWKNVVGKLMI